MSRSRVLALVFVWLVVVAGVTALVWAVIANVGERAAPANQPPVATTWHTGPPPSSPSPEPTSSDLVEERTWQGPGGSVVAACDQEGVHLVSAQPADGFRVEVKNDGPDELKVEFESHGRHGHGDHEVKVFASCVAGVPTFTSKTDD